MFSPFFGLSRRRRRPARPPISEPPNKLLKQEEGFVLLVLDWENIRVRIETAGLPVVPVRTDIRNLVKKEVGSISLAMTFMPYCSTDRGVEASREGWVTMVAPPAKPTGDDLADEKMATWTKLLVQHPALRIRHVVVLSEDRDFSPLMAELRDLRHLERVCQMWMEVNPPYDIVSEEVLAGDTRQSRFSLESVRNYQIQCAEEEQAWQETLRSLKGLDEYTSGRDYQMVRAAISTLAERLVSPTNFGILTHRILYKDLERVFPARGLELKIHGLLRAMIAEGILTQEGPGTGASTEYVLNHENIVVSAVLRRKGGDSFLTQPRAH